MKETFPRLYFLSSESTVFGLQFSSKSEAVNRLDFLPLAVKLGGSRHETLWDHWFQFPRCQWRHTISVIQIIDLKNQKIQFLEGSRNVFL